jgi:hypothetical protein
MKPKKMKEYQAVALEKIKIPESFFGYVVYFCGAPVATKSKLGRSITLSLTEAEHFAISCELNHEVNTIKLLKLKREVSLLCINLLVNKKSPQTKPESKILKDT